MITIKEVNTNKEIKEFIEFPLRLYKDNPYFVPPLYGDEKDLFKKETVYSDQAESVFYLAVDEKAKPLAEYKAFYNALATKNGTKKGLDLPVLTVLTTKKLQMLCLRRLKTGQRVKKWTK